MYTAWLDVGSNGNVGIVTWTSFGINAEEAAVEEIIEALVNGICLHHHHCVAFCSRMADSTNGVDLKSEM